MNYAERHLKLAYDARANNMPELAALHFQAVNLHRKAHLSPLDAQAAAAATTLAFDAEPVEHDRDENGKFTAGGKNASQHRDAAKAYKDKPNAEEHEHRAAFQHNSAAGHLDSAEAAHARGDKGVANAAHGWAKEAAAKAEHHASGDISEPWSKGFSGGKWGKNG